MNASRALGPAGVLLGHTVATFLNALLFANTVWLMPLLVRLRFGADDVHWRDWQTTLITAAVPIFMMLSIFWNELLQRIPLRTYLLVFWLVAVFPLGCIGFVHNYWQLLACHVVATIGFAGQTPVNGKLLKHFYPDAMRGRAYAVLNAVTLASGVAGVYVVGTWMEARPGAYRIYFPVVAVLQLLWLVVLLQLTRRTQVQPEAPPPTVRSWAALLRPVWHMSAVLRTDRTFLRYERAFMTYGAAFMLCDALLPVLATTKLGMRYEEYAHSTQVVFRVAMLVMMLPMGWLLDRIGPVRTSCLAFAVLAGYPVLLLFARGPLGVGVASVLYGVGMAGVAMGWMLGPLALAGRPEKVPQYVAIHATLVGVRGIIFQGLGMLLYKLTGSFTWPLVVAALAFLWAAVQMQRLHGTIRQSAKAVADASRPDAGCAPALSTDTRSATDSS